MKRWFLLAAFAADTPAFAHHGWIRLKSGDKTWLVVLTPPAPWKASG